MFKNLNFYSRALIIALAVIAVMAFVGCLICNLIPGADYSKDYAVYTELKDMSNTFELMDYCHEGNIKYSINNNHFELEGYRISFELEKSNCAINNNRHMNFFYLLDEGRYDSADCEKLADGSKVYTYTIKILGTRYTLSQGTYMVHHTLPAFIFFCIFMAAVVFLFTYLHFCATCCKRCQQYRSVTAE